MKKQSLQISLEMRDYLKQHQTVVLAIDTIMKECGLIYPTIKYLFDAKDNIIKAIQSQAVIDLGILDVINDSETKAKTNFSWNWNRDFENWRKEKSGIINSERPE